MVSSALCASVPSALALCANCGAALGGPYCASCGQRVRDGRLTVRHVAAQAFGELSAVDHGLLYTAASLFRRPGHTVREYLGGRTVRYVGPVKYFLLLVGLAQLVSLRSGEIAEVTAGFFDAARDSDAHAPGSQRAAADFLARYFVSLGALGVPVLAAWSRLVFRRAGLTFAEHVAFALYLGAQQIVLLTVATAAIDWLHVKPLILVYLLAAAAYQALAFRQLAGGGAVAATLRTLLVLALTLASGVLLVATLVAPLVARAGR